MWTPFTQLPEFHRESVMLINVSHAPRVFAGLMVLALAACGGNNSTMSPTTPTQTTSGSNSATVTIPASSGVYGSGMSTFSPGTVTISVGGSVTWKNNDAVTHTTTSDSPGWDQTVTAGSSVTQTFMTAGTFPYHCRLHSMSGIVIVQ